MLTKRLAIVAAILISASCGGGGGATDSTSPPVTPPVTPAAVASVTVTHGGDSVSIGTPLQLVASPLSSTGAAISGKTITWTTSDQTVLTVSSTGLVTAVSPGNATISATVDNIAGAAALKSVYASPYVFTEVGKVLGPSDLGFAPSTATGTADAGAIELPDKRIRVYFGIFDGINGPGHLGSAISSDGRTFTVEAGRRDPAGAGGTEGFGSPLVIALPSGGYRLFYNGCHLGGCGISSSTSADGITFTADAGLRFSSPVANQQPACGGVVPVSSGSYRMYCSVATSSQTVGTATFTVNAVFTAISSDLLAWTLEPGFRVGTGAIITTDANHPSPTVNKDGSVSIIYWSTRSGSKTEYIATSKDGLTFNSEAATGLIGTEPSFVKRADGSRLLYHGDNTPTAGSTIILTTVADR